MLHTGPFVLLLSLQTIYIQRERILNLSLAWEYSPLTPADAKRSGDREVHRWGASPSTYGRYRPALAVIPAPGTVQLREPLAGQWIRHTPSCESRTLSSPPSQRELDTNFIPVDSRGKHADLTFISLLAGVLRFMGLSVLNHSSDLNEEQSAGIIADFNDPKKRVDVAIFTLGLSLVGVNMHYACHHGMFLSFTDNPASGKQAQGRLVRSGQREIVYWYIIKQVGSYADVQERMIHTKQAQFHKAQALVPGEVTRSLRDIVCYELAREEWGTLESNLGSMCIQSTRASSMVV